MARFTLVRSLFSSQEGVSQVIDKEKESPVAWKISRIQACKNRLELVNP
jgi:hypothetical protein